MLKIKILVIFYCRAERGRSSDSEAKRAFSEEIYESGGFNSGGSCADLKRNRDL